MNLLLCLGSREHISELIDHHSAGPQPHPTLPFITCVQILQHSVHILHSGHALFETAYKVTKALTLQKYHLALKISQGTAYVPTIAPGTILNIINEKPGDFGKMNNHQWMDLYDASLLHANDPPHRRGGFINLTNSYMNVFLPYQKAVGLTVNHINNQTMFPLRAEKYTPHCETSDGLGFVYPCLAENQPYYHLCMALSPTSTSSSAPLSPVHLASEILGKL